MNKQPPTTAIRGKTDSQLVAEGLHLTEDEERREIARRAIQDEEKVMGRTGEVVVYVFSEGRFRAAAQNEALELIVSHRGSLRSTPPRGRNLPAGVLFDGRLPAKPNKRLQRDLIVLCRANHGRLPYDDAQTIALYRKRFPQRRRPRLCEIADATEALSKAGLIYAAGGWNWRLRDQEPSKTQETVRKPGFSQENPGKK